MEVTSEPKPPTGYMIGLIFALLLLGIVPLYLAVTLTIELVTELSNQAELITFEKGSFYLFGVGTGLLLLAFGLIYSKLFNKEISKSLNVLLSRLVIGAVILTFILPQIIHYSVANYLENEGYQVCEEKSRRWLHNVTIVYTKTLPCEEEKQSIRNGARVY